MDNRAETGAVLWSIGHSTHTLEEFLALLGGQRIERLADIRTVPKSRRHPHFRKDELAQSVPAAGLAYRHMAGLGGFRRPRADSPNDAWENESFRGYADYTHTPEFATALEELADWARGAPTAMMCSEGLWWRCHRRLVADRMLLAGWEVRHVAPDGRTTTHALTPFARRGGDVLVYPAAE